MFNFVQFIGHCWMEDANDCSRLAIWMLFNERQCWKNGYKSVHIFINMRQLVFPLKHGGSHLSINNQARSRQHRIRLFCPQQNQQAATFIVYNDFMIIWFYILLLLLYTAMSDLVFGCNVSLCACACARTHRMPNNLMCCVAHNKHTHTHSNTYHIYMACNKCKKKEEKTILWL